MGGFFTQVGGFFSHSGGMFFTQVGGGLSFALAADSALVLFQLVILFSARWDCVINVRFSRISLFEDLLMEMIFSEESTWPEDLQVDATTEESI